MKLRDTRWRRAALLACVWVVLALPVISQEDAVSDAPSIAELTSKLDRALQAGNMEGAVYRYRALRQATGQENGAFLGQIGRLVLLRDLRAGRGWLAVNAARTLALGGDEEALQLLLRFAGGVEQQANLRVGALKALGEVGGESAARMARQVADDDDRAMMERLTALDALLAMREFSAVQSLSLVLRSAERKHRIRALQILRDRSAPATDLLRWAARDEDPEINLLALEGLLKLRDTEAAQTLSDLLGDGKVVILPVYPSSTQPEEGKSAPLHNYSQFNPALRMARALLPMRDPKAMAFVAEAALHPDVPYNQAPLAAELVLVSPVRGEEILQELMAKGSPSERLDAAAALGNRGHAAEAVPVLAEVYRASETNAERAVRLHAIIALAEIGTVQALALVRGAALQDPSDIVRQRAAHELALAGDSVGLQVLRGLLETADRLLQQSTAVALVEVARQQGAAPPRVTGGQLAPVP